MKELTIHLKAAGKHPLYQQIYQYIRKDMIDGKISQGEKLPSTRLLAKHLQISRSTVELAYGQLLSEGYLRAVPGSGYFACGIENLYGNLSINREPYSPVAVRTSTAYRYDFSPNTVEWSDFSMASWRKATKTMLQENMEDLFLPGSPLGEENLRQAICDYLYQARGVSCGPQQIIIGAGNEYLLMLLAQVLGNTTGIAMESPTYRQAYETFCNLGFRVVTIEVDEEGMLPTGLHKAETSLAYIMPSHQFPLGTVMPMRRRIELLQWAGQQEGRYIIEDDYDSEFRYKGKPIPSLQSNDPFGRVIYLGTFSKSIAPAIRISYLVLPPGLMEKYHSKCGFYSSTVSRIQQQTLLHFIKGGYFERHLNKMRGIYRGRRDALLSSLKGKPWVRRIYGDNAGLHILVELSFVHQEEAIIAAAKTRGVRVYGLFEYAAGDAPTVGRPTLLLGYASLAEENIVEGVTRLDQIFKEIAGAQ